MRKMLAVTLLLLLAVRADAIMMIGFGESTGGGGPEFVQSYGLYSSSSANTISQTFLYTVTTGNTIIVWARVSSDGSSITGVADNCSNSYTQRVTNSTGRFKFYEASNVTGGVCTVTVSFAALGTHRALGIFEIAGLLNTGAYDAGKIMESYRVGVGATDGNYSDNITTTQAGDFMIAVSYNGSGSNTIVAGTGWSENWKNAASATIHFEDMTAGAAGSYRATWTPNDTDSYIASIIALKAAP